MGYEVLSISTCVESETQKATFTSTTRRGNNQPWLWPQLNNSGVFETTGIVSRHKVWRSLTRGMVNCCALLAVTPLPWFDFALAGCYELEFSNWSWDVSKSSSAFDELLMIWWRVVGVGVLWLDWSGALGSWSVSFWWSHTPRRENELEQPWWGVIIVGGWLAGLAAAFREPSSVTKLVWRLEVISMAPCSAMGRTTVSALVVWAHSLW